MGDRESFQIAVEQVGGTMHTEHRHGLETAGWLAIEPGHGTLGETQYEAGIAHDCHETPTIIEFTTPFQVKPEVFGSIASWGGHDASQLRQDALAYDNIGDGTADQVSQPVTERGMRFVIEEENCVDREAAGEGAVNDGLGGNCVLGQGVEYIAGNGCHPWGEDVAWLALGNAWTAVPGQSDGSGADQVCFGAGGDDLGDDNYARFELPVDAQAVKLVYQSGGVSCNFAGRGYYSRWGCDEDRTSSMGTFLTKADKGGMSTLADIVAPVRDHVVSDNLWYEPFDDNHAMGNELTFSAGAQNGPGITFTGQAAGEYPAGQYLIWYGEDLADRSQHDNGGATCVKVFYLPAPVRSEQDQNINQQMTNAQFDRLGLTNQIVKAVHVSQPLSSVGEMGTVILNTNWITVVLEDQSYTRPIVFCSVPSRAGGDPVVCRINRLRYAPIVRRHRGDGTLETTGCGGWCFEIALQEPSCKDQWHTEEEVSWMVIEEGSFLSDDGAMLQTGLKQLAGNGWATVRYRGSGFPQIPAHLTQIQTTNGGYCTNGDGSVAGADAGITCSAQNHVTQGMDQWTDQSFDETFFADLDMSPFTKVSVITQYDCRARSQSH